MFKKWQVKPRRFDEPYREADVHSSDSDSDSDSDESGSAKQQRRLAEPKPILKKPQKFVWPRENHHSKKVTWMPLGKSAASDTSATRAGQESSKNTPRPKSLSPEHLASLKLAELKPLLRERGLPVSGRKGVLVSRLLACSGEDDGASESQRLMRQSNIELKTLLRKKGLSQQGNKQVLVDRLLGREVQSQRKIVKWDKSKARQLLLEMLRDKRSQVRNMQANEVRESHEWFQDYPPANFKRYFEDMKAAAKKHEEKVDRDNANISMELEKFPRNGLTNRGYPFWDTHPASRLLRFDIEGGKDNLTPTELRMSRDEYRAFPLQVFRYHIYQERRRVRESKLKVVQRNKKALKSHLVEVRQNKKTWDKIAMGAEVGEATSRLTQLNI